MNGHTRATVAVCLLLLVAGCSGSLASPFDGNSDETRTPTGGGSDGTAPYGVVRLSVDSYEVQNGTHQMSARVDFRAPLNDSLESTTFEEVMVCFYDENGTVLNGTSIGDSQTPEDEASATLSSEIQPTYVIADHPRFRTYGEIHVRFYELGSDGEYLPGWVDRDDFGTSFGYPRHTQRKQCL